MTHKFICFSSEDEGFRFKVGKPFSSLEGAEAFAAKYFKETAPNASGPLKFTEEQLENTCEPDTHGRCVRLYCLDGDQYADMRDNPDDGYAYDWFYIYRV